ncbi:MAG: hypothetical protein COB60_04065 [Flavobacteriaceae bacterium]|nr:MAG: hypothetical protein COB60_04065 [Flavobacteriaceae bacterium]
MDATHLQHLYWRAGFGIGYKQHSILNKKTKKRIVSDLFKDAKSLKPLEIDLEEFSSLKELPYKELIKNFGKKEIKALQKRSRKKVRDLNIAWVHRLSSSDSILREKMTLFWANVFVCKDANIWHIQQFNNVLRTHALGDFKQFVKAISREPSMSKYLNNRQNIKGSPNENFARELMELFTLGAGNYSEKDIKEAARAFTGWTFKHDGTYRLNRRKHDYDSKIFFGQQGNFDGTDIIDIILEQKQCAKFICEKVYRYFINPSVDQTRLDEITDVFYKDYNIEHLMQYIFNSEWFYESRNIGVKIKSPMDLLTGIRRVVPFNFDKKKHLYYLQKMMGQILLNPVNVSGWKGNRNWIDSNTLMFRLKLPSILLNKAVINLDEKGDIEGTFNNYYSRTKNRKQYIKTTIDWAIFKDEYQYCTPKQLKDILISSVIDPDTEALLSNLDIENNKDYCIQLMSIPEYQLC